ncbi:MAG: type II secretion system GspH family protein [Puniceicoccales bacterium]|jgi:prepilin-type N-terminal cleavage/methylation domain-containing protein|nr:type II secretion system GspH family protein [Puniceicoccales bacterium]
MRRGFSLLEVVLAIGILGLSLPILLTHMAENTGKMEKRMQEIFVANTGKNVQNVLNAVTKAPILDANNQAYCGYQDGVFMIANAATGFDGIIFVLVRKAVENVINGGVSETTYALYPWDSQNQKPRLTLQSAAVKQYIVAVSLGTIALINKVVLGDILAMQEGVAKAKASWAYASVSESSYGHNKEYGAAQIFEYTSHVNKNYINSIAGNDAIAQNYAQEHLSGK